MANSKKATRPTAKGSALHNPKGRGATPNSQKHGKREEKVSTKTLGGVRENSKLATVVTMLRSSKGTTIEELSKATGWQAHSVRGAISGAIKKKLGLTVTSVKSDDGTRTYRINP